MRTAGFFIVLFLAAPIALAKDKLPVPGKASQAESLEVVQEEFRSDVDAAADPVAKIELVERLIAEARNSSSDPDRKYSVLQLAIRVAPDIPTTMKVIKVIGETFEIDVFNTKATGVWRVSKKARLKDEHAAVASAAYQLILEAIEKDDYDSADKLATIAVTAAKRSKDRAAMKQMRTTEKDLKKLRIQYGKVKEALVVLEKEPDDPDANLLAGKYRCFVKDDWESGLAMLAAGSNQEFQSVADRELQEPQTSDDQLKLADSWYDLAKKSANYKNQIMTRAAFWYEKSLRSQPALAGKDKARVEKRIALMSGSGSRATAKKKSRGNDFVSAVRMIKAYKRQIEESLAAPELDTNDKKKAYADQHRQEWLRNIQKLVAQANKYKTATMKYRIKLFQVAPASTKEGHYRVLFEENEEGFLKDGFYVDLTPAQANGVKAGDNFILRARVAVVLLNAVGGQYVEKMRKLRENTKPLGIESVLPNTTSSRYVIQYYMTDWKYSFEPAKDGKLD